MTGFGESAEAGMNVHAGFLAQALLGEGIGAPRFRFDFECIGPDDRDRDDYLRLMFDAERAEQAGDFARAAGLRGDAETLRKRQWEDTAYNTVTTAGKNALIDKTFKASAYTAAWYLGLKGTGSVAAGDTLASHSGWSEITAYTGNRQAITFGSTSSGSNTASANSFSMNGSYDVYGAFICDAASGTSGTLYSAGDIAAHRAGASGDTLSITPTVSIS